MMLDDATKRVIERAGLNSEQKLLLIVDNTTIHIGESFLKHANSLINIGSLASVKMFNLDDYRRPIDLLPEEIRDAALRSDLLLMLVRKVSDSRTDEYLTLRKPILDLRQINKKLRIGQILDVNIETFVAAFNYDPQEVKELNKRLIKLLTEEDERLIRLRTKIGTDITFRTDNSSLRWINQDADLSKPSAQHSLLAGEVYTCPADARGIIAVDGVMGGRFMRYGKLSSTPCIITIKEGKVIDIMSKNSDLVSEFKKMLSSVKNAERIGEIGLGTNTGLKRLFGIIGIDEKYPGMHVAFGNPYPERTGAAWKSPVHVDAVMTGCDIWVDDLKIMENGEYLTYRLPASNSIS